LLPFVFQKVWVSFVRYRSDFRTRQDASPFSAVSLPLSSLCLNSEWDVAQRLWSSPFQKRLEIAWVPDRVVGHGRSSHSISMKAHSAQGLDGELA
jgi:hypothetical protein